MKTINYILAMGFSFLSAHGQTLDFTHIEHRPLSWKDVFDGGFRPWWRGNGEYKAHQSGVEITLRNGNKEFTLTSGDIQFSVSKGYTLEMISFYGRENLSYEEAQARNEQFIDTFGSYENIRKIQKGAIYKTKDGSPFNFHSEKNNSGVFLDDYKFLLAFSRSGIEGKPFVERFTLSNSFSTYREGLSRVGGQLQPPTGYEHLSLDPQIANKEYYDLARRAEEYNRPEEQATRETEPPEIASIRPTTSEAPKTRAVSWWIFCAIGTTTLIILIWLKLSSSKR